MKRVMLLSLFLLFAFACKQHTPTPKGTAVAEKSDFEQAAGTPKTITKTITLEDDTAPTTVDVVMDVMTVGTTQQFSSVAIVVQKSGGWEVSGGGWGNPMNLGTEEAGVMAIPVIVSRYKVTGCGQRIRQTSLTLKADGTVQVD